MTNKRPFANGSYVFLVKMNKYGLIKSKKSDKDMLIRLRNEKGEHEEVNVSLEDGAEELLSEVEISVRVVMSEEKRFTTVLRCNANSKLKDLEEGLTDLLSMPKYSMAFFFKGEKISLGERLGDREIG
jgi:hypothetical protein